MGKKSIELHSCMVRFYKVLLIALCLVSVRVSAQTPDYRIYSIFIYNFIKYIEWPESANPNEFVIGTLGKTMMKNELMHMAQTKSEAIGKKIIIVECNTLSEAKACNILFIPANHSSKMEEVIEHLKNEAILYVTEKEGLAQKGSCINFILKDGKMKFEMNKESIQKSKLKVSNELVRLAVLI